MNPITEFEAEFKKFTKSPNAIACSSGTAGLHTSLLALGVNLGDKVITTPFSFIASSNAILYCGAAPVFADIRLDNYCIDPVEVEKKVDEDSDIVGILCVHLFGNTCDLNSLQSICRKNNLFLVEDCAQAFGATYKGLHVGNFGDFGVFSFYETKRKLWTFEGGMMTTPNNNLANLARMIINHGREIGTRHNHVMLGYNYRMHPFAAQMGTTFLRHHKTEILSELSSYGIKEGYYPYVIYDQPLYKKLGIKGNCPNAEKAAGEARKWVK